jgi:hypothetical protein
MILMTVYIVLCVVAEAIAAIAGSYFEDMYPTASLTVFLFTFFIILVVMWPIAIRLTANWDKEAPKAGV